jgi:MFS family permease
MTTTATSGYWTVLRTPRVPSLLAAGALGRLPGGILPFALVVAFARQDGFAIAGAGAAVFMLATALTGPRRGRLVDRHGTAALVALAVIQAGCAAATAALIWAHWTIPALVAVAACSATAPPVSAALRARWSGAVTNKDQLRQIHSVDSIVEEVTFIVAPLVATAAMTLTSPAATVIAGSLIYFAAVAILMAIPAAPPHPVPDANQPPSEPDTPEHADRRSLIRLAVGQGIIVPIASLGIFAGGISVILPAIAAATGEITSAGYLFAVFSIGGAVGGLIHGKLHTAIPLRSRYFLIAAYLAAATIAVALTATTPAAYGTVALAGAAVTPLFVVAYLLVDEHLSKKRQVEANAWIGSGYNLGSGLGSAACGLALANASATLVAAGLFLITATGAIFVWRIPQRPSTKPSTTTLQTSAQK